MFYVKTALDGTLEQYPYTLADLRCKNKNTSWPQNISNELAAEFGVFLVSPTPQPADRYDINLRRTASKQGSNWVEQWIKTPATPEQIAERTAAKEAEVRQQRNQLLSNCDWTQLPDAPVSPAPWATYRQQLRNITAQNGFPWDVIWPVIPSESRPVQFMEQMPGGNSIATGTNANAANAGAIATGQSSTASGVSSQASDLDLNAVPAMGVIS